MRGAAAVSRRSGLSGARGGGRRPKATKLSACPRLLAAVENGLVGRLVAGADLGQTEGDYPDDLEMRISHETIYLSLFVQSRGELRRQLTAQLRTGRPAQPQGRAEQAGADRGDGR